MGAGFEARQANHYRRTVQSKFEILPFTSSARFPAGGMNRKAGSDFPILQARYALRSSLNALRDRVFRTEVREAKVPV
jgi:hypothetical protein